MATVLPIEERAFGQTKGQLRQLRLSGWIPAVLYGAKEEPKALQILTKAFLKQIEAQGIYTRVFDLGTLGMALVKAMQFPPTKDTPLHIDFLRLSKDGTVTVSVPLRFTHEEKSPGIKRGGILNVVHYTLDLVVSAQDIPSELSISLAKMDIGNSLHIEDIPLPTGAKVLHVHPGDTIASLVAPSGLVEKAEEEGQEEEDKDE